ncbi:alanine racemase [Candidatus Bandiella euplotis]|uniref:alanine racemase n=1 Tax=Candidatus Bandiella euplotis TaxID=1664265 RepID=A0ABZ0UKU1_9RICK|nr:alanine racemase [Candidatus Bandiella woodruffii]WPX96741.1 Alanine racemase, biosynthetic [Candidatus Bandiella woodruffii]
MHSFQALDSQYIKINLLNVAKNYLKLKSMLKDASVVCSAVVKANAYGLGIKEVSEILHQYGCCDFWVMNIEEALIVRETSPHANIYVFQGVNGVEELKAMLHYKLVPVVSHTRQLEIINNFPNHPIEVILNFDTGIGRDGFQLEEIEQLNLKYCDIRYVMSHLSRSEIKEHPFNEEQLQAVKSLKERFPNSKFTFSNSGGIFLGQNYHFDLVRPGGALYGVNILEGKKNPMLNVVEFNASVLNHKIFNKAHSIGYGGTYKVNKGDKVLILNTGYYDGYRRVLSNKSRVYAEGFYLPVIGVVSMNLTAVDANQLPDELFHTIKNVELIGEKITIEEIAKLANTDQREILTNLQYNCKRIYIK